MITIVIFISELRPSLLDEVCSKHFLMYSNVQEREFKRFIVGGGADFSYTSHFVVDLSAINDDYSEVLEAVSAIQSMYRGKRLVFLADKEPENSPIISKLIDKGVYDIITQLSDEELEKCLLAGKTKDEALDLLENPTTVETKKVLPEIPLPENSIAEKPMPTPPISTKEKLTANRDFRKHKAFVTVAVSGTEPHIGTTHQALLITKFLSAIGFKACYLEANPIHKIHYIAGAYTVNANERKKVLQFEGVDMYFDFKLTDVISAGYDFFVFDFGCFQHTQPTAFLTKDIKIVVGGAKAWEIPAYRAVFDGVGGLTDINFILNFAPQREKADIKALMGDYRGTTFFSEFAPYPFEYGVNHNIYKAIFEDYVTVEKAETGAETFKKAKTKIFGRW